MSRGKSTDAQIAAYRRLMISDVSEMRLLSVPDDKRQKVAEFWAKPLVRMPKEGGATYRFINYLTETGLLDDRRDTSGVGWRNFSFVELVYINTVMALRKFGIKNETIQKVHEVFALPYDPERTGYMGLAWVDVLVYISCGGEMELLVQNDGEVIICDPQTMHLFGKGATEGMLRISLSTMVNQARKTFGLDAVKITSSFGELPLTESETDTVLEMRNLQKNQEALHIRRTKNGVLVEKEKVDSDSEFAKKLTALMEEHGVPFGSVNAISRDGRVVNVKKTETQRFAN